MKILNRFSFQSILIFTCLAFALVPLALIAVFSYTSAVRSADQRATNFASAAINLADKIDRNLFERYGDVQAFGLNQAVQDERWWYEKDESSPIVQAMNSYVDTYDIYYFTLLVDLEGHLIAVNTKDDSGVAVDTAFLYERDYSNEQWFRDCLAGHFYESEDGSFTGTVMEHLYIDESVKTAYGDEGLSLGYSAPVKNEHGEVIAIWKNVTKFSLVEDIVLATYIDLKDQGLPSAEVTLLDRAGNIIVDCDPTVSGREEIIRDMSIIGHFNLAQKGVEAAERVVKGETGSITDSYHARKEISQVAGFAPFKGALGFPGMEWNALVRVAADEALAAQIATQRTSIWLIAITSVVVAALAWIISRAIAKVLSRTVKSMEAAEEGDYSQHVDSNLSADLSRMTGSLNKLLDALTESSARDADFRGQLEAIGRSQAVIEFQLDGTILTANENFLGALGYTLEEIVGKHHRMFVDTEYAKSADYKSFWEQLARGEFLAGEYQRFGKDGKEIWIQASYNPILDADGKPYKVVKYATDITPAKEMERQIRETQEREQQQADEQSRKVTELLEVVNAVAAGDLSAEMPDFGNDVVGKVAGGVGKAVKSIRTTMQQVRDVAVTVATSARELAIASEQISNGAQSQASSLEETAASLEEITSGVKQNTDNSQQAQQLSNSSREVAETGGGVVGDAVEAMSAINQASKKIAEIITTIDEIAFQTNLLALNAAVEAARAGEQGRGFAVVASEVRNLAQRSAGAAKEIKNLIQDSVQKVENGTELVNKSGETLQEIVTSVKRVADIVTEISAASSEQLTGVEQVNNAVSQMDRITQTNAAQTEEMAGTSQSLLSHSEQLQQLVGAFMLGDDASFAPTPTVTAPASPAAGGTEWNSAAGEFGMPDSLPDLDLVGSGPQSGGQGGDFIEF